MSEQELAEMSEVEDTPSHEEEQHANEGVQNEAEENVEAVSDDAVSDEVIDNEVLAADAEEDQTAEIQAAEDVSDITEDSVDAESSAVEEKSEADASDEEAETKEENAFEEVPDEELVEEVDENTLQQIIEGALLAAGKTLNVAKLKALFPEMACPSDEKILAALDRIAEACENRGFELKEVASGFRFQVRQELSSWVGRLWEEKPQRYTRALLETLALIAYRQPITRGEIEEIRGVSVSSSIVKTLMERDWVRIVGHRDVPGRPAMYATTREFLDYFNLKNLDELPPLSEIRDLDEINKKLQLDDSPEGVSLSMPTAEEDDQEQDSVLDEINFKEIDALNESFEKPPVPEDEESEAVEGEMSEGENIEGTQEDLLSEPSAEADANSVTAAAVQGESISGDASPSDEVVDGAEENNDDSATNQQQES